MILGTRTNGIEGVATELFFEFKKNQQPFSAHEFLRVEIYPTYDDALAGTNIIETITDITETDTGVYRYIASPIENDGTYHDKVYLIPEDGYDTYEQINTFYIKNEDFGGTTPDDIQVVQINIDANTINAMGFLGLPIEVRMNLNSAKYGKIQIINRNFKYKIGDDGSISFELIETDTMTQDTFPDTGDDREVYYVFDFGGGKLVETKRVPKGYLELDYADLPNVDINYQKFSGETEITRIEDYNTRLY